MKKPDFQETKTKKPQKQSLYFKTAASLFFKCQTIFTTLGYLDFTHWPLILFCFFQGCDRKLAFTRSMLCWKKRSLFFQRDALTMHALVTFGKQRVPFFIWMSHEIKSNCSSAFLDKQIFVSVFFFFLSMANTAIALP